MDCSQAVLTLLLLVPCGEPAGEAPDTQAAGARDAPAIVQPAPPTAPEELPDAGSVSAAAAAPEAPDSPAAERTGAPGAGSKSSFPG